MYRGNISEHKDHIDLNMLKNVKLPLGEGFILDWTLSQIRYPGDLLLGGVETVRRGGRTGQSFPCTSLVIRSFYPESLSALGVDKLFF